MAQGATRPIRANQIRAYYKAESALVARPANIAAADTLAAVGNRLQYARPGSVLPGVNAGAAATPNIEWEELGAASVQFTPGLAPAPTADENSLEVIISANFTDAMHVAFLTAPAGQYAQVAFDFQTSAGDGTRGNSAANAQGTIVCFVVQHADAPIAIPSGTEILTFTERFTIVDDSGGAKGRVIYHYGPP